MHAAPAKTGFGYEPKIVELDRPFNAQAVVGQFLNPNFILEPEKEIKGGRVNYYLVHVTHPQREEQPPYQAECEDVIEALALNPDEANIFKEIWRGANARKNNGKPGNTPLYGAQKIVHYAGRILRRMTREAA